MKLLLDENLSPRLIAMLPDSFANSLHVLHVEFGKKTDSNIWKYAQANGFAILTKDSDFAARTVGTPNGPKVIWLRLGNCATEEVLLLLRRRNHEMLAFGRQSVARCLILESRHFGTR